FAVRGQHRREIGIVPRSIGEQGEACRILPHSAPGADDAGTGGGGAPRIGAIDHGHRTTFTRKVVGGAGPEDSRADDDSFHGLPTCPWLAARLNASSWDRRAPPLNGGCWGGPTNLSSNTPLAAPLPLLRLSLKGLFPSLPSSLPPVRV